MNLLVYVTVERKVVAERIQKQDVLDQSTDYEENVIAKLFVVVIGSRRLVRGSRTTCSRQLGLLQGRKPFCEY